MRCERAGGRRIMCPISPTLLPQRIQRRSREPALLHPEFLEIGRSGRAWSRDDVALSPTVDGGIFDEVITLDRLAADSILLVFRTRDERGATLRSSLWVRDGGRWRLRFHQGTPAD